MVLWQYLPVIKEISSLLFRERVFVFGPVCRKRRKAVCRPCVLCSAESPSVKGKVFFLEECFFLGWPRRKSSRKITRGVPRDFLLGGGFSIYHPPLITIYNFVFGIGGGLILARIDSLLPVADILNKFCLSLF